MDMNLNGQTITNAKEQLDTLCICGHNQLGHVHFNGGLNIPEGTPTWCGFDECQCGKFQKRIYKTTESVPRGIDRKFERVVNLFASIEIYFRYDLPTDFCDEFLATLKNLSDDVKHALETENG